jgi:hypothetical protein
MKQQIEALIALAKEATPGPWRNSWSAGNVYVDGPVGSDTVVFRLSREYTKDADAEYIAAANPAALLPILELALKGVEHSAGSTSDASGSAEAAAPGADAVIDWVSVDDRLPNDEDYNTQFLCLIEWPGLGPIPRVTEWTWTDKHYTILGWDYQSRNGEKITHWTTTPELPTTAIGTSPAAVAGRQQGAESGEDKA